MRSTVAASTDASARDRNSMSVAAAPSEGRIRAAARAGLRRIKDAARWLVDTVGGVGSKLLAFARKVKGGVSRRSSRANAAPLRFPAAPKAHEHEASAPSSSEPPHERIEATLTTTATNTSPPRAEHDEPDAPDGEPENAPLAQEAAIKHAPKQEAASEPERPAKRRVRVVGPAEGWPFTFRIAEDVVMKPARVTFELGADDPETWPFRMPGLVTSLAGTDVEDVY